MDVSIDGSSEGATPHRYSMAKEFDMISDDDSGYAEVRKCGNANIAKLKVRNVDKNQAHRKAMNIKRHGDKLISLSCIYFLLDRFVINKICYIECYSCITISQLIND